LAYPEIYPSCRCPKFGIPVDVETLNVSESGTGEEALGEFEAEEG